MLRREGNTPIDVRTAGVTVTVVEPEVPPKVALVLVEPGLVPVTNPCDPCALLTVATPTTLETQIADAVRSSVEPSENSPTAVI